MSKNTSLDLFKGLCVSGWGGGGLEALTYVRIRARTTLNFKIYCAGITPDIHVYGSLLQCYVLSNNIPKMMELQQKMICEKMDVPLFFQTDKKLNVCFAGQR